MASFTTAIYPTGDSNVTNVAGDHLTFHTGDVIIIHYHVHPLAVALVDRDHTGERVAPVVYGTPLVLITYCMDEGTTGGDQVGALPARGADVVVSVTSIPIPFNALHHIEPHIAHANSASTRLSLEEILWAVRVPNGLHECVH